MPELPLGQQHRNAALLDVDQMLQHATGTKTLAVICPALAPDASAAAARHQSRLITEEQYADKEAQLQRAQQQLPMLNPEQRTAFDAIIAAAAAGEVTHSAAPRLRGPPRLCNGHLFRGALHVMLRLPCLSTQGASFFIDGPGGTGKTFLYDTLLAHVRGNGGIALAVASSGIAALLLEGGRTAHSRFKIPVNGLDALSTCG